MPLAAWADDGATADAQAADWQMRLDKAAAMQAESRARQAEADRVLAEKNAECATTFFVNDCRNAATRKHLEATRANRRLEIDGKAMAREVKREQLSRRNRTEADEAPRRAAKLEIREAKSINSRHAAEDKEAAIRASKAAKAVEGEKRKAAEAEKIRKRQAEHAAKIARKKQEAQQRAAPAAEAK